MKKLLLTAAAMIGMSVPVAQAGVINIGGVNFDTGAIFKFANILENVPLVTGEELKGYGLVTQINAHLGTATGDLCVGCELTFVFDGFTLSPQGAADDFVFTGGSIRFYVDYTPDYTPADETTADNDGVLWLELAGHTMTNLNSGFTGTLISENATVTATGVTNSGRGAFSAVGGLAMGNFDTNTIDDALLGLNPYTIDGPNADFLFTSSFQLASFALNPAFPIQGTGELQGFAISEPIGLGILGFGLVGLGLAARRRRS